LHGYVVRTRIVAMTKNPLDDARLEIANNNHLLEGNYLRFARKIAISLDTKWERELTTWQKTVVWAIAGFYAARYGYRSTSPFSGESMTRAEG
jgi:hypothetical protein